MNFAIYLEFTIFNCAKRILFGYFFKHAIVFHVTLRLFVPSGHITLVNSRQTRGTPPMFFHKLNKTRLVTKTKEIFVVYTLKMCLSAGTSTASRLNMKF